MKGPRLWRTTRTYLHNRQRGVVKALPRQAWVSVLPEMGIIDVRYVPLTANKRRPHGKRITRTVPSGHKWIFVTDEELEITTQSAAVVEIAIFRWPPEQGRGGPALAPRPLRTVGKAPEAGKPSGCILGRSCAFPGHAAGSPAQIGLGDSLTP